ncbi:MAG: DUF2163 domain-containing protein [Brevundimonas sp.]|jgi:uncharacterized phage protein (TIGR02218 family)|nr:DUF2163 domain-containing protein [Brevundimonas sp.]
MSRVWFAGPLETVAPFWRILRRDGVTLGFTAHDRDLWFGGALHRAAPGMVPSAIRRSADLEPDSAEVEGALSHDALSPADLALGRFDAAQVLIGLVDWETLDSHVLYRGAIGSVSDEGGRFTAVLQSRKAELQHDPIPRTSPTCRAQFCGPGCTLSPARFSHAATVIAYDLATNAVGLQTSVAPALLGGGTLRWLDGPYAGQSMGIIAPGPTGLVLDRPLDEAIPPGAAAMVREGCDRTLTTCTGRFGNAINFQGEPFLPGNDQLTRYAVPSG